MKRRLLVLLAGAAVAVLFATAAVAAEETRYKIPLEDSPYLGPATAPVVVFEFLDYQ